MLSRFMSHVDQTASDGCWVWTAKKDRHGYGWFSISRRKMSLAHRFAYTVLVGEIPDGMTIDHICRNRLCVNPEHLRSCSASENLWNQGKQRNNTSGFKGVTWNASAKKWQAQICAKGKSHYLGLFVSPLDAHRAYCDSASRLHGAFANFGGNS